MFTFSSTSFFFCCSSATVIFSVIWLCLPRHIVSPKLDRLEVGGSIDDIYHLDHFLIVSSLNAVFFNSWSSFATYFLCTTISYHLETMSHLFSLYISYVYLSCFVFAGKKTLFRLFLFHLDGFRYGVGADIDIYFDWSMVCNMLSTSLRFNEWTCLVFNWADMDRSIAIG